MILGLVMISGIVFADSPGTQPTSRNAKVHIVLVGDSTVNDGGGWGPGFKACLDESVECTNLALNGRSSKSFIAEGVWKKALDLKPDYVLIQFGHNDQTGHGADRETDLPTYKKFMTQYVEDARAAGIKPVLVTSISRRQWGNDGMIHSTLEDRVAVVKEIAQEKDVPLIDLHSRSIEVYESLGKEGCEVISAKTADGKIDNTHLSKAGGMLFGAMVAMELRSTLTELNPVIRGLRGPSSRPVYASSRPSNAVPMPTSGPSGSLTAQGAKTIVVAQDGSGDFKTIQEAIAAAPENNSDRTNISIKPGTYIGQFVVPASKPNVSFVGDDTDKTILTYALNVIDPIPAGVAFPTNGNGLVILGNDFHAQNLTIRNTAGDRGQAMALRVQGDRAVFQHCKITGWQDTLLLNAGRDYFKDCLIEGRVDYIYGAAAAVFDHCEIETRNGGHITAASTPENQPFGFVFMDCKITSSNGVAADLGRPWRPYANVIYMNCEMGSFIKPQGWMNWVGNNNHETARYAEYKSTGPGGSAEKRVPWSKQLTKEEAEQITIPRVLGGKDQWDPTKEIK
jgi:pectinesterase